MMKVALLFVLGLAATNAVELNGKTFESGECLCRPSPLTNLLF